MRVFHSSPSRCRPLERTTAARTSLFGHRTVRHQSPANARSPKHSAGDASTAQPWSLTSLREKLIKIGAKVVSHGRYVTFQMAEVAVPRQMFGR